MKKRRRKIKTIKFSIILSFLIIMISFGYSYFSTTLNIKGRVTSLTSGEIILDENSNPNLNFSKPTENDWQEGGLYKTQFNFNLLNIGQETYDNYKITITFSQNIVNVNTWNNDYEIKGNQVILSNGGVNIAPGTSREIGFIVGYQNSGIHIRKIKLETSTDIEEIDPSKVIITFNQSGAWGNYTYQYNVSVTNQTGKTINYWQLEILLPSGTSFVSGWSAKFNLSNNNLTVINEAYNGTINNNSSVSFGLQLNTNIQNYKPTDVKVSIR